MRVKLSHTQYIARKIALKLVNTDFIQVLTDVEDLKNIAMMVIEEDIKNEMKLDTKVNQLIEDYEGDGLSEVDYGQVFWQIKKKFAKEFDVIIEKDDRYNELSHKILDEYWQRESIDYKVTENKVRNVIYEAIDEFLKNFDKVEDAVQKRLSNYKRKLIPGTEDYELIYQKTYEDELRKRGM